MGRQQKVTPAVPAVPTFTVPGATKKQGKGEAATSPKKLTKKQKAAAAVEMRIHGWTFDEIAEALGYRNRGTVHRLVQEAMVQTVEPPAHELRQLEAARLDRLQAAHFSSALGGNVKATDIVLNIMKRRAALLGLDMPIKFDVDFEKELRDAGIDPTQALQLLIAFFAGAGGGADGDGLVIPGSATALIASVANG